MNSKESYSSQKPKVKTFAYKLIYNKKFETYNKGKKIQKNIFIKVNIMEYKGLSFTFSKLFDHIGELHLFEYILQKCQEAKDKIYLHDKRSVPLIQKELQIAPSTQIKYLALLIKKELLLKDGRGYYKINPKFIEL